SPLVMATDKRTEVRTPSCPPPQEVCSIRRPYRDAPIQRRVRSSRRAPRLALIGTLISTLVAAAVTVAYPQPGPRSNQTRVDLSAPRAAARPDPALLRDAVDLARRIAVVSARYLGTSYVRDPLGEGPGATPDSDRLFCRTGVDCQTYVEQVLAEAVA